MYAGSAGIAWLLIHLHALAPSDERVYAVARGALSFAVQSMHSVPRASAPGLFQGLSGIALTLLRAGECLHDDRLTDLGLGVLKRTTAHLHDAICDDLVDGIAGAVPALLTAHAICGDRWPMERAIGAGEQLMRGAVGTAVGRRARRGPFVAGGRRATGFAHGPAGVGWALCELFAATGDSAFRDAALAAFRHENRSFDRERRNWRDLRDDAVRFPLSWCRGAAGIGIARLRAYELVGADWLMADIHAALRTTSADVRRRARMSRPNLCICHGVGGNIDFLLLAAQAFGRVRLARGAHRSWRVALRGRDRTGQWPCGRKEAVGTIARVPGLFAGLAGIGYCALRLAAPDRVPSVLAPTATRSYGSRRHAT